MVASRGVEYPTIDDISRNYGSATIALSPQFGRVIVILYLLNHRAVSFATYNEMTSLFGI